MATFNWETYRDTPGWKDISTSGTFVFAGSNTDLTAAVTVGEWNAGTHIGTNDPGTDMCGTNHSRNVKWISNTQFDSGSGTETLTETNLTQTEATLRIKFTDASSVSISGARFYSFNGAATQTEAVGVTAYACETITGLSTWTKINDDAGDIGGDNTGERLDLSNQTQETVHYFYVSVSTSPQSVGAKTQYDFGVALTYS